MVDSAEAIARVLDDIRKRRFRWPDSNMDERVRLVAQMRALQSETVVDITPVYQDLFERVNRGDNIGLYESFPCITPPWEHAWFGYVNRHGNVSLLQTTRVPIDRTADRIDIIDPQLGITVGRWETTNPIDWDRAKWITDSFIWVGGRHAELPPGAPDLPTTGPAHLFQAVIADNGEPLDLHWVQLLSDVDPHTWDASQAVLSAGLNFLNCSNVDAVEPARPRPARRRLQRLGVQVHILVVRPVGRRSHTKGEPVQPGVPLASVRGHFAEYGPRYGKGKLFGKLEGRYWIPAYARGSADHGEVRKSYKLDPRGRPREPTGASGSVGGADTRT
jgi:hypothetical protein